MSTPRILSFFLKDKEDVDFIDFVEFGSDRFYDPLAGVFVLLYDYVSR